MSDSLRQNKQAQNWKKISNKLQTVENCKEHMIWPNLRKLEISIKYESNNWSFSQIAWVMYLWVCVCKKIKMDKL